MKGLRLTPTISITLGIISLTMLMFFMLDRVIGVIPDADAQVREIREKTSTNLALQLSTLLKSEDNDLLSRTLASIQTRNDDILSLAIRLQNGELLSQSGYHRKFWTPPPGDKSTITHVQIPIYQQEQNWGKIEICFRPNESNSIQAVLRKPSIAIPATIFFLGFFLYYVYLRRVLNHLDPTQVIPDRVNAALDTLTEGVMIIDKKENILLTNENFKRLHPEAVLSTVGKKVSSLKWLSRVIEKQLETQPWKQVVRTEAPVSHIVVKIPQPEKQELIVSINAAPVRDSQGKVQGCLVTFSDITQKEITTNKLKQTLKQLQKSQTKIEAQNIELQRLANYDQLTGILNRRAFFEQGEQQIELCTQTNMPLICIMCDIDHFKLINDNHGHPVGDSAIKVVTSLLSRNIRQNDVLGRYGGEEFCLVLPGIDQAKGTEIAERMRDSIEKLAGKGVRSVDGLRITSSFGMSVLASKDQTLSELIELADKALYESKENGRNKVSCYSPDLERQAS